MLCQALRLFSNTSVNSNWSYNAKTTNSGKTWRSFVPCGLEMWQINLKNHRAYFPITSSFVHHFVATCEFKLDLQLNSKSAIFVPRDLEIWRMTLKNTRKSLLCYFKLGASFRSRLWIETGITVGEHPIWLKSTIFVPWELEICRMT